MSWAKVEKKEPEKRQQTKQQTQTKQQAIDIESIAKRIADKHYEKRNKEIELERQKEEEQERQRQIAEEREKQDKQRRILEEQEEQKQIEEEQERQQQIQIEQERQREEQRLANLTNCPHCGQLSIDKEKLKDIFTMDKSCPECGQKIEKCYKCDEPMKPGDYLYKHGCKNLSNYDIGIERSLERIEKEREQDRQRQNPRGLLKSIFG